MTIIGPLADEAPQEHLDDETPMGPTARLVRSLTPQGLIERSRPVRAKVRYSIPAAALWTARKRAKYAFHVPATYNEKIEYKLAWDRRPITTTFADKVAVRGYVERKVGAEVLPALHTVASDPREIDLTVLPSRYVVKPSHGSGCVTIVHDRADPALRLARLKSDRGWVRSTQWVRPEHLDRPTFDAICDHWLRYGYWRALGSTEWAYRDIPRRILVEEFLEDGDAAPRDFKFMVMNGRVSWFRLNINVGAACFTTNFRRDGSIIPVVHINPSAEPPAELPDNIDDLIRVAEALGTETDLVRVDLYDVGGRVVFGELTNYPSAGRGSFDPPEYDRILGADWTPPRRYRTLGS